MKRVRIITDIMSYGPREEWIDKVQTTKVKRKGSIINSVGKVYHLYYFFDYKKKETHQKNL